MDILHHKTHEGVSYCTLGYINAEERHIRILMDEVERLQDELTYWKAKATDVIREANRAPDLRLAQLSNGCICIQGSNDWRLGSYSAVLQINYEQASTQRDC